MSWYSGKENTNQQYVGLLQTKSGENEADDIGAYYRVIE